MPDNRLLLSRYLFQPRRFPLAPPPPPSAEPPPPESLAPDAYSQPIYCAPPKQRCTSLRCSHSTWTRDHPEFVQQRDFQRSANINGFTYLPERLRDKVAGLIQFDGFFRPLSSNRYKQVAPSGYCKIPEDFGVYVPACGARARIIDRNAEGEGWWIACHRVPRVAPGGRLEYANTCGMFTKIHYYSKYLNTAREAEDVPQFAIRLGNPIPPKAPAGKKRRKSDAPAPQTKKSTSASKRRHSVAGPSVAGPSAGARSHKANVIDLTSSDN
ncbi:hypothetical protein AURDEDRAFT_168426 [Auricularia subglabra TFB-10046 SS5]|nr:hypothetical protein AURDEDRAFT_168426 [Auricularia subglabra TFB-10046 SS5]